MKNYYFRMRIVVTTIVALLGLWTSAGAADLSVPWQARVANSLPLLGHRNWIVIADSAYPWQTSPGIETIHTDQDQITVTKAVLDALSRTKHVKPTVYLDAELTHVPENDAKGVTRYRQELKQLLKGRSVQSKPHEQIIADLDAAGKTFHVLLLKTTMTIPYTSVFLQLDCGYWDSAAEDKMRKTIKDGQKGE
jgi:L-fucose mutarotase/ribose pyranase (RbsD/FucU family)